MGCFSFLCKECDKGIQSNSFSGQDCLLFLLKKGEVIQAMEGQYDSYGRVFIEETQRQDVKHELKESHMWNHPDTGRKPKDANDEDDRSWGAVCDLMFDDDNSNGIAAFHKKCYKNEIPVTRSESDPNQGWGDPDENDEDLMGNVDPDHKYE